MVAKVAFMQTTGYNPGINKSAAGNVLAFPDGLVAHDGVSTMSKSEFTSGSIAPCNSAFNALDLFLSGKVGFFDYLLDYELTPEFEQDLKDYQDQHKAELAESLDERNAYHRVWAAHNQKKVDAIHARRAERIAALPNDFTEADWQRCLNYFGNRCAVCGRGAGLFNSIAKGHWIPVAKGGSFTTDNIIPLCNGQDGCNNSQYSNLPNEWLVQTLGKRKATILIKRVETYFASLTRKAA